MKWYLSRSRGRPHLFNISQSLSKEQKDHVKNLQLNMKELNVFVDASEKTDTGVFGLGVCFVRNGNLVVKSKRYDNWNIRGKNTYAELKAISFSLMEILTQEIEVPSKIKIYSDSNVIKRYRKEEEVEHRNILIKGLFKEISLYHKEIEDKYPGLELKIDYLNGEFKRHNSFYKAAHNAARIAINLRKE